MGLRTLKKEDVGRFVDNLIKEFEVFGPVPVDGKTAFQKAGSFPDITLDYANTLLPPKKFLLPQEEVLFTYTLGDTPEMKANIENPARVVFGARSCDLHGIRLLDDIFAEGSPDAHYFARRKGTFFVGLDCKEPCSPNSFCKDMGTLKPGGGYDLFFTDMGGVYGVEVGSKAGVALLEYGEFHYPTYRQKDLFLDTWRKKLEEFPNLLGYDVNRLPVLLADAYDDPLWDALEERCFDCGACTVVCPTCYCFDVFDRNEADGVHGARCRRWDSCQLRAFALIASGENMRGKRSDRLRHRLFRKGKYFKEWYDRFACVGCGRCGRACLVRIDVREIFIQVGAKCPMP